MYTVKPLRKVKNISVLTVLACFLIVFINYYYLFSLNVKLKSVKEKYEEVLSNQSKSYISDIDKTKSFYDEIDTIMHKKGQGIYIEKLSLSNKLLLIQGMANSLDQVNIFKDNMGDSFLLKKVVKQEERYSFELEKRYE